MLVTNLAFLEISLTSTFCSPLAIIITPHLERLEVLLTATLW